MIVKIVLISNKELVLIYDNKPSVRLSDSSGNVLDFARWFFSPTVIRLSDYKKRVESGSEETILLAGAA